MNKPASGANAARGEEQGMGIGMKLRAARRSRQLTLRELAVRTNLSASLLSQIENGKANPSVSSLYSIAAALELPVDYFLNGRGEADELQAEVSESDTSAAVEATPGPVAYSNGATSQELPTPAQVRNHSALPAGWPNGAGPIVRRGERAHIELMGGVIWERLTPGPEEVAEILQICYAPGANSGAEMSHHNGREFGVVLEGEMILELGFERYVLHAGDSVIFDSTTPHRLTNPGAIPLRALWVIFKSA